MVSGAPGVTGPSVARLVVEELRPDRDSAIVQFQRVVVETVLVRLLREGIKIQKKKKYDICHTLV